MNERVQYFVTFRLQGHGSSLIHGPYDTHAEARKRAGDSGTIVRTLGERPFGRVTPVMFGELRRAAELAAAVQSGTDDDDVQLLCALVLDAFHAIKHPDRLKAPKAQETARGDS